MKRTESRHQGVFTVHEVASRLRVSPRTVWAWIQTGRLTAIRLGARTTRIPEAAVQELLRAASEAE